MLTENIQQHTEQCVSILWHQLQSVRAAWALFSKRQISAALWQFTQRLAQTSLCPYHVVQLCGKRCCQLQDMDKLSTLLPQCSDACGYVWIRRSPAATSEMFTHILLSNYQRAGWPWLQGVKGWCLWRHKQPSRLWRAWRWWCFSTHSWQTTTVSLRNIFMKWCTNLLALQQVDEHDDGSYKLPCIYEKLFVVKTSSKKQLWLLKW